MDEDMEFESAAAVFEQAALQYQNPTVNNSGDRKMLYVPLHCGPLEG